MILHGELDDLHVAREIKVSAHSNLKVYFCNYYNRYLSVLLCTFSKTEKKRKNHKRTKRKEKTTKEQKERKKTLTVIM